MKLGWFLYLVVFVVSCSSSTVEETVEEVLGYSDDIPVLVSQYDSFSTQFLKSYAVNTNKAKQFDCVEFAKSDARNHLEQEVLYFFYELGDEIDFSTATNVNEAYNIAVKSKPVCSCKYVNGVYVQ